MQFSVHPESSYLRVEMTGLPSAPEVQAMFAELAKQAGDAPRVMIELRVDECLNFVEVVEVMSSLPDLGLRHDGRLALVITEDRMRASAQFAETVGVNRGFAVRVFDRRDAAFAWLGA
jgi:hypothetical protein